MKKKIRDSAISSEDLDDAIASRIELAFKEQQRTLNSVVNSAVREVMSREALIPLRKRRILSAPCLSGERMPRLCGGTTGEQRPLFLRPGGRGLMARTDMALAAQWGRIAGLTWTLAKPIFCFFFSPLFYWNIVPIYPVQRSLCW